MAHPEGDGAPLHETEAPPLLVARQPVFDRSDAVVGYELLYRGGEPDAEGNGGWAERATSSVLLELLTNGRLEALVEGYRAFINLPRSFLLAFQGAALDPGRFVLEVLEDVDPDSAVMDALRALKESGYTLALDDFVLNGPHQALLGYADMVKVDIQSYDRAELTECVRELQRHPVGLLAEKVETPEEHMLCRELGFEWFQGYFYARPQGVSGSALSSRRLSALRLLGKLQDPQNDLEDLATLISQDVDLTYRLLRLINSAFFPIRSRIDSVHRALVYLGREPVRTWAAWLTMGSVPGKPSELAMTGLIRARMAENVAGQLRASKTDIHFTTGLVSILDALFDRPMAEVVAELPLSAEVEAALLRHEGPVGRVLADVMTYERGEWRDTARTGLTQDRLAESYLEAVAWTQSVRDALN
ncbi:EAL and HDOD domain-containing protein [Thiohalorhabdus methylotrophus]|uniref:EAL and HDOD domain-containing protein n=1 Tax=Thiohalorhabdus methylotrophus TaxID=3242694 RepID=A0ABV4TYP3_9GAMM